MSKSVIVVGTGNAALCAALAALESGARVTLLEKADKPLSGGNTKYTAGAMRFAYDGADDLLPLLRNPEDPRVKRADLAATRQKNLPMIFWGSMMGGPCPKSRRRWSISPGQPCAGWPRMV